MSADFGMYEFAAGSVKGIREFRIDPLGRLTGYSYNSVWKPGENEATCRRRISTKECMENHRHQSMPTGPQCFDSKPCDGMDAACSCGFYAFYGNVSEYSHMGNYSGFGRGVTGIIEGFGKTIVGTKGFRCEKARIIALCIPREDAETASDIEPEEAESRLRLVARTYAPMLGFIPGLAFAGRNPLWASLAVLAVAVACFVLGSFTLRSRLDARRSALRLPPLVAAAKAALPADLARVRENYSDVPTYPTVEAMLAAHPTDQRAESLTPQSDPNFWDREISA